MGSLGPLALAHWRGRAAVGRAAEYYPANPARTLVLAFLQSQLENARVYHVEFVLDIGMNRREVVLVGANEGRGAGDRQDGEKGRAEAVAG